MSTFELVVEQVRGVAGADFAFVLTRRGRLVTRDAPRDMPEVGRAALMDAARTLERGAVGELTIPRQELVPFGGAAPVDVHFAVAADQAILCVVMSSWVGKSMVSRALHDGIAKIEAVIAASGREPIRRRKSVAPPPMNKTTAGLVIAEGATTHAVRSLERPPVIQRASSRPPARPRVSSLPEISVGTTELGRESLAALDRETIGDRRARGRPPSSPQISVSEGELGRESLAAIDSEVRGKRRGTLPQISVSEGVLGRESLAAIDSEVRGKRRGTLPQISVSEGVLGRESLAAIDSEVRGIPRGSLPQITLGEASLGRESLAALEHEEEEERPSGVRLAVRPPATSMPDTLRIELESFDDLEVQPPASQPASQRTLRATQPWVELPEAAKRTLDAESLGRATTPPGVTVKLEDADSGVFEAARIDPVPVRVPAVKRRK